jgi:Kdo2-lipid IVA lauroyltransferase/acyltransferase
VTHSFLLGLSHIINWMPRSLRVALGSVLGWTWFNILRFRRQVVLDNMRLALGKEKTPAEITALASENFRHYGLLIVEYLQSLTWKSPDYFKNVPFDGVENLKSALAEGNGVYVLSLHLGNWEWVMGTLVAHGIPADAVVKRSKNAAADKIILEHRKNMGMGILFESGTASDILKSLAQGRMVAFMLDQFMGPPIGLPVNFFGQLAGTAIGLALISEKRNAPVVVLYSYRDANGILRCVAEPKLQMPALAEDREDRMYDKTQFYNDALEKIVRRHPGQWLWLHRRWKAYRGEPRWKRNPGLAPVTAILLATLLVGCATSFRTEDTPTGIALPADAVVNVPDAAEIEGTATEPVPAPEKTGKKSKKAKEAPAPAPAVVASPKPGMPINPRVFTPEQVPFEVGERMVISLNWGALAAGDVRLEVREGLGFQGRNTYKIWGNVLSSPLVDTIYHVDNTIESYVDKQWLLPYKFLLHMVETHQLKETKAVFDHKLNKVNYWSKRISKKWGDELQDRVDTTLPSARDMFSALYYARVLEYKMGEAREIPIYENRQNIVASLLPVANEMVHTKAGAFQCWKMAVTVKIDNVLKPSGEMFLWFSDDWKKYIVKFDAKLKIGSLVGELTSVRERL